MKTNTDIQAEHIHQTENISALIASTSPAVIPLDTINGFSVRPGFYTMNGAVAITGGVSFTIHSNGASCCELLLFHRQETKPYAILPFPQNYKIGYVYSMLVFGLDVEDFEYAYRFDGPYDPSKGLLFDKNKILLDPYAKAVTGQSTWGLKLDTEQGYRGRVVKNNFDWGVTANPFIPMSDLIIYEAHVRGLTKMDKHTKHPGTYAGIMEKIPYLKKLGVNAIELMPIFEFDELADHRVYEGRDLVNYWGYNTVAFFAPNTSYTASTEYNHEGRELKQLIKALHENHIEIILDVVFNHTAEGNENGPFISFKGMDNNIFYLLTPDGHYYNFSGCGNSLNCNHPVVMSMIIDCLRYWTTTYRIDGFRFDLASILGRNEDGSPMEKPPLLHALATDPILGNVKLIAEAWDAGGLYQVGNFPAFNRWAEWNGRYRDDIRQFLKGDLWQAGAAASRITGSQDIYNPKYRGTDASINFLTCHDGFTLYDLYAYNFKHNEANGWGNTDGCNDNHSWNCGLEGETNDPNVNALRYRMIKNAFATLMCSRGTPMFLAGDEFGNTQYGNNNSYCQDSKISWLDWSYFEKNKDLFRFCQYMIKFRKDHPIICHALTASRMGFPDTSIHGKNPWNSNLSNDTSVLAVMFAGFDMQKHKEDIVYLTINAFWETQEITLPDLNSNLKWYLAVNTGSKQEMTYSNQNMPVIQHRRFIIKERSVSIFVAK